MSRDALVVGINVYQSESLPNLTSPAEDAEAIAQMLEKYGDFDIVRRFPEAIGEGNQPIVGKQLEVQLRELKKALAQLFKPEGKHIPDTAVFYFSGHGLRNILGVSEGFLATSDTDPDSGSDGLSMNWLRRLLVESSIPQQVVWLDCCHSGQLLIAEANPGDSGLAKARCFIASSREFEVSWSDLNSPYSVMTKALLEGLDPNRSPERWIDTLSLADYVNRRLRRELQKPICTNSGAAIKLTRLWQIASQKLPEYQLDNGICPYKGLFAFQQEDAIFFFGRKEFIATALEFLKKKPFLAIIGNSGIGKSSVVFAGLIPELLRLGNWQFLTFRPKNNPFVQLAEELTGFLNPALTKDEPQFIQEQANYAESLKNKEFKLTDILDDKLAKNHLDQRLLIVVDQFEELYTLCSPDDRNLFIENLLTLIDSEKKKKNPDVVILITLRVDFYGFALDYQPLAELLQKWEPKTLIGMSREELELAIEKPAEVVGLKIQDGLTKIILDEVTNNPGELPLLEFALGELWKQRNNHQLTIAAYHEIGCIEKALANYAESVYKKFEGKQPQIKHIFTQLVRFGEQTENTRRLATYEQIGQANWELVTQLADNRLVVTGQNIRQRTAEVVHEALIRGWERLQQWMAEDRDFRQWQDRLRFGIKTWEETAKSNSALLRGALLVEAEDWLKEKPEAITDAQEIEFIKVSRQFQEQEDIERIQDLLNLSQKELQLKQQLISLFLAVKAGIKLRNIQEPSEELKRNVIGRLQQGSYEISEQNQLKHAREVNGIAFSPDASMIASVSDDRTVELWTSDGKLLKILEGHTDDVLR
ncbi:MAG: caspase family protein, partial [Limnothrix sp.]